MKTRVHIGFNGASYIYTFNMEKEALINKFNNHITAVGYFCEYDQNGNYVTINPSNCGTIEIIEVK